MAVYIDTSAFFKLVRDEQHSRALHAWLRNEPPTLVGSELLRIEGIRVTRRISPTLLAEARSRLSAIPQLRVTSDTWMRAAELEPAGLRSLDALHLALALTMNEDLEAMLTYDERLTEACAHHGIRVIAPRDA